MQLDDMMPVIYLNILQRQNIFHVPLGYFNFGCNATDTTDHIIIVPDSQAFKGPISIAQQLLKLTQFLSAQIFLCWEKTEKRIM